MEDQDEVGEEFHRRKYVIVHRDLHVPAVDNELGIHNHKGQGDHDADHHCCVVLQASEFKERACNEYDSQQEGKDQEDITQECQLPILGVIK